MLQADGAADAGRTQARKVQRALEREAAFRELAGKDRRPLLVVRECIACNGTDDALLSQGADNERTLLLTRYFHCVKLPPEVTEPDHPFHELFPGDDPPHLFVARSDGDALRPLTGEQSRTELWGVMGDTLKAAYVKDPQGFLRDLTKGLDRLDVLDEKLAQVERRIERELEQRGPRSRKLKGLERDRQELKVERAEVRERLDALARAQLRPLEQESQQAG